jgi:hypothetical protein
MRSLPNLYYIFSSQHARAKIVVDNIYRGADKSLARPGGKQAAATEDFDVRISYLLS